MITKPNAFIFIFILLQYALEGCSTSENIKFSPDCSTSYTYAADVSPIIASKCATSGCHNSGSSQGPGALVTYTQIITARSAIKTAVASGAMPRGSTLTAEQKNAILCWIENGSANN